MTPEPSPSERTTERAFVEADAADTTTAVPERSGRGVIATWWYTFGSALFLAIFVLIFWSVPPLTAGTTGDLIRPIGYLVGAVVWLTVFVLLGINYRNTPAGESVALRWSWTVVLLIVGLLSAAGIGLTVGSMTILGSLSGVLLCVLPWPSGVRWRVTALVSAIIIVLAWVEFGRFTITASPDIASGWVVIFAFAAALPLSVVSMLWWWDIVRELDSARATEGRLAATQERLRMASDVHDLQGHHLQVIALQLELAERLLDQDTAAAREQLQAAQRSVDAARTGTRELATRFRGVPLPDELANAADLLRASGIRVVLAVDPGADQAPSDVLGPVIRESTTNILKHGGGQFARLELRRDDGAWRFSALNDRGVVDRTELSAGHDGDSGEPASTSGTAEAGAPDGAGIIGMGERVAQAGGTLTTSAPSTTQFELTARVPAEGEQ
ncbi:MAG: histidine kinase [Mycetocola sp.]